MRFRTILQLLSCALPLSALGALPSNSQDHACLKEYQVNNFEKAMAICMPAAQLNNPEAQYVIGMLYKRGKVVEHSEIKAMEWLSQAAENGYAAAQLKLGKMLSTISPPDYDKAFTYFLSAAQSALEAQFLVALCYQNGLGVSKNPSLALQWYNKAILNGFDAPLLESKKIPQAKAHKKNALTNSFMALKEAADNGDTHAQFEVAQCYLNGQDTEQNDPKALSYFKAAAAKGHYQAKGYLAWMNAHGIGTPPKSPPSGILVCQLL